MPIMYWLEWYNYYTSAWTTLNNASQGLIYQFTHVNVGRVFDPAQPLQYRVIAQNGVGMGVNYSPVLVVTSITAPTNMDPITIVAVTPYNITLSWPMLTPSYNGGDAPFFYLVQWNNSGTIVNLTKSTNGLLLTYTHVMGSQYPPNTYQRYLVIPQN